MNQVAALLYWVIVGLWLVVLVTIVVTSLRTPRLFGPTLLLLAVLAVDTTRNVIENVYFGLYFGSQYGLFPGTIAEVLGQPRLLILPKILNVIAAVIVIILLLRRWLSMATNERVKAADDLTQSETQFRMLVDAVTEYAIFTLSPKGYVASWNPGAQLIKGYTSMEAIGTHFSRFFLEEDRVAGVAEQALAIAARDGRVETVGQRIRKDGTTFWAHGSIAAIRDAAGTLVGFANVTKDITEAKLAEAKLNNLAYFDQLTGLPNRVSLLADLDEMLRPLEGVQTQPMSLALLDLDGFKAVNDTLGHAMGDRVLVEVARRLSGVAVGRVYRLGDDEFVLSASGRGETTFIESVEALLTALEPEFVVGNSSVFLGASAGVVEGLDDQPDASALLAQADLALQDAKRTGGHRASCFMPDMRAKAQARQQLDLELHRACSSGQFEIYFQPQVRLSDDAVVGAEALLRWHHPRRGLLSPGEFIEVLSQSLIAVEVGRWILQTACMATAAWRTVGWPDFQIGVNLFAAHFHGGRLVDDVEAALRCTGLPPDALELEITENIALSRDDEIMLRSLRSLRSRGVGLAFDDFGTGYASLSSLTRYPLTRIKIDRAFVQTLGPDSPSQQTAIARSVIAVGHNLVDRI